MIQWSYSGDPGTSDRDQVRFLIGDTDQSKPQLSDPEVDFMIMQEGGAVSAAIVACERLAARFAGQPTSKSVGDVSYDFGQRQQQYLDLADSLRRRRDVLAVPYAGGTSKFDKETRANDSDAVPPAFAVDMMKNP